MFYVKEDDMDDLLRRAAENYDVNAEKGYDWERVRASIEEPAPARAVVQPKRKRRFIFLWLLLIPLGWFASTEWSKFHSVQQSKPVVKQSSDISKEKSAGPYENKNSSQAQPKETSGNTRPVIDQQKNSYQNINKVAGNKVNSRSNSSDGSVPATPKPHTSSKDQIAENNSVQVTEQPRKNENNNNTVNSDKILPRQNAPLPDLMKTGDSKKDQATNNTVASSSLKNKEKTSTHYFYMGIVAGPDISFVKFQQTKATGFNLGLIAGYKFNKLSVETGLIYDKKNYYTAGEYFDKGKIPFFYNAEVLSVEGYCHMYEIPVNITYNFGEKRNHSWFAGAGLSSYLMSKEYYDFKYVKNGTAYEGGYPYYHASKNWFSIVNLSAGYELKTGKKTNLRIEPYYKIPITGVGTGNISLSSTGVNISLTRRIP